MPSTAEIGKFIWSHIRIVFYIMGAIFSLGIWIGSSKSFTLIGALPLIIAVLFISLAYYVNKNPVRRNISDQILS